MNHDADVLALNELKWKAELRRIYHDFINESHSNTTSVLDDVIQSEIGREKEAIFSERYC